MFDLQAGIDFEEREEVFAGVVEELDGCGASVPDCDCETLCGCLEVCDLLGCENRRCRLLDDLLISTLHRAVADAERPCGALAVGDDLNLDVAGAGDESFEEDDAAAEGAGGFIAGAVEGVAEFVVAGDDADTATSTACGCLQHQRIADRRRGFERVVDGVDGPTAPRRDRNTDLFGDQLGADLVAEFAHRLGGRADEGDADAVA